MPYSTVASAINKSDTNTVNKLLEESRKVYSSNFKKSIDFALKAFYLADSIHFYKGTATAKTYMGIANYYQGEHDKAIAFYIDAIGIYKKINDQNGVAFIYNEMATAYKKHGDIDKAQIYLEDALKVFKEQKNNKGIAHTLDNLGIVYEQKKDLDMALKCYIASRDIRLKLNDSLGLSYNYINIGGIYMMLKRYDESLENIMKSIAIREALKDTQAIAISYNNIGEMYFSKPDYKNAIPYFEKSIALSSKIGYNDLHQYTSNLIAECYAQIGNYSKAYEYEKISKTIRDKIFNETKNRQLTEIKTKYETDKKEQENILLTEQNKVKDLELKNRNYQIITLIIIAILAALLFIFIFYRNKLKQREILNAELLKQEQLRNKAIIITQEEERKRIAADLHDGIGQMMSAARLNVASLEFDVDAANEKYKNAIKLIDESCREIRNISHIMMPGILLKSGIVAATKEFSDNINSAKKINIIVDADENVKRFDEIIEINLFRIIQELTNNIIKYAEASSIQIQFNADSDLLTILIEDNGKGFNFESLKLSSGNGWNNINSRLHLLNGKIEIDSKPQMGTVVFITIPITKKYD